MSLQLGGTRKGGFNTKANILEYSEGGVKNSGEKNMIFSSRFVCWDGIRLSFPTVRKKKCSFCGNKI